MGGAIWFSRAPVYPAFARVALLAPRRGGGGGDRPDYTLGAVEMAERLTRRRSLALFPEHYRLCETLIGSLAKNIFRTFAAVILFTGIASRYYAARRMKTGEQSRHDGQAMMALITIGGLILWSSPIVYLINRPRCRGPRLASRAGALAWRLDWNPVRLGNLLAVQQHRQWDLADERNSQRTQTRAAGPYRCAASTLHGWLSMFISFGVMADNWFIVVRGLRSSGWQFAHWGRSQFIRSLR